MEHLALEMRHLDGSPERLVHRIEANDRRVIREACCHLTPCVEVLLLKVEIGPEAIERVDNLWLEIVEKPRIARLEARIGFGAAGPARGAVATAGFAVHVLMHV